MPDTECTFRLARAGDASAIVELVNSANSGAGGTAGWTHEANLFEGKRTDIAEVLDLYADPGSAFVLCMEGEEIVGCAYLKRIRSSAYMGLLSVRPALQARGVGSKLIAECERMARREWHCPTILISVITSHRPEITSFYERRGYVRTGRLKTFERKNARLAPGVTGLVLEWMEKPLAGNPLPLRNNNHPGAGRYVATLTLVALFLAIAAVSALEHLRPTPAQHPLIVIGD